MKSKLSFDEFKLNSDGMIPVITQDYKTNEVLKDIRDRKDDLL